MGQVLDISRVVWIGYKGKKNSVSVKYHKVCQTRTLKSGNFCYYWRLSDKSDNERLVWKLLPWPSTCLGLSPTQYRTALHLLHQERIFATLSSCFSLGESRQQSSSWSWKLRDSFLSAICLHKVSFTCPRAPTRLPAQQWFWSGAQRIKVLPLAVGLLFSVATNSCSPEGFVRGRNERVVTAEWWGCWTWTAMGTGPKMWYYNPYPDMTSVSTDLLVWLKVAYLTHIRLTHPVTFQPSVTISKPNWMRCSEHAPRFNAPFDPEVQ